jgi:hypothetical protein
MHSEVEKTPKVLANFRLCIYDIVMVGEFRIENQLESSIVEPGQPRFSCYRAGEPEPLLVEDMSAHNSFRLNRP